VWTSKLPPQPAWPGPAKRDAYNKVEHLESRLSFDRAFHVVSAKGRVYFGSSADDQVRCLDARTGEPLWTFFTEAPVRFAPTLHGDRILFGSDDGHAYCLAAKTGVEIWRYRAANRDVRVPGNGRLMSPWPVRTGITIRDDIAYFCAGLFPSEGAWLCAVRAATGKLVFKRPLQGTHPQGYMLASGKHLYVPTGRGKPAVHRRKDGVKIRDLGGAGGTFALLVGDSLIYGPGKTGQLGEFEGAGDQVATFHGLHMIVSGDHSWLHNGRDVSALDRKRFLKLTGEQRILRARSRALGKKLKGMKPTKPDQAVVRRTQMDIEKLGSRLDVIKKQLPGCVLWTTPCDMRYELIKTKTLLFVGGDGVIAAYSTTNGEELWRRAVRGRAWGIAAADGRLFVSTDEGLIYCFTGGRG
jgi:outer membrane protein assembly factor BamB